MSSKLNLEALFSVLHIHLGSLCNGRAFPYVAPPSAVMPYVVYSFMGGGETDRRRKENSTLILSVKGVSGHLEEALSTARLIRDLLRYQGDQEDNTLPLDSEWRITTVSQGVLIDMVEIWEDGTTFYHSGSQYTFTMELKP